MAIVGPCASGKSSVAQALRALGYQAQEIAQEHTAIQTLWRRSARPDVLIYLHVSYQEARRRRAMLQANADWWDEQLDRLENARRSADLVVDTDCLNLEQVIEHVLTALQLEPAP
jgi:cytidylate kinase